MIIRTAASEHEIDRALDVYLYTDPSAGIYDRAEVLAHWLVMYTSSPQSFWIAEDEASNQIVGVASAILRPPQWILANFYILPGFQGLGIGKKLLHQVFSTQEGCQRFMVHASSNPPAQNLYLQFGMYPQPYSILFKGNPEPGALRSTLTIERYPIGEILPTLNSFDLRSLGFSRAVDHQRWAMNGSYFLAKKDNEAVAYFRVSPEGMIGPLVVSDEQWMPAALDAAIVKQKEISTGPHEIFVPGANRAAIAYLLARGYRFVDLNLLMSSHPMPGLAQVVFHDMDLL